MTSKNKKLSLEEKVYNFNSSYTLTDKTFRPCVTLLYNPTGEIFQCDIYNFLKGKAHAPSIVKDIKQDKYKKTCLERYGVENVMMNKQIQEKAQKTCLEKYGGISPTLSPEIRFKQIETNLKKYGSKYSLENEEIKRKAIETNLKKYGVENSFADKEIREKIKKTNLERYGVECVMMDKRIHKEAMLKAKKTKLEKGVTRTVRGKSVKELAGDLGISPDHVNKLIRSGADISTYKKSGGTSIEQTLKLILDQLGLESQREKYFNDNKIRVDFYVPKFNLIIEANGIYWHSDKRVEKDYHYTRRKTLNSLGLDVIQFNEIEILKDPIKVKYMIIDFIESGGKESYIYEDDHLIVNLDYSIPPTNLELVEEWIQEYSIEEHKIYNSGVQKLRLQGEIKYE